LIAGERFPSGPADGDLSGFGCGNAELDRWLVDHALASQKADLARTYLALDGGAVVGYVSLTTGSIRHEVAPKRFARGMPRHPIPTILIARLAVDSRYQGQRLGSRLLAEALRLAVIASDTAAARLLVVDAIDEQAAGFYRRWDFIDVPENPDRLFRKISEVRRWLKDDHE
jgi:ribosomal protein S18 acetylase RimI-like enzyme